jgi:hypothetical protein
MQRLGGRSRRADPMDGVSEGGAPGAGERQCEADQWARRGGQDTGPPMAPPDMLICPDSASPFEDIAGKIFDILDGWERTSHNIRLGVRYTRTVSAALPLQIIYTMLFWSFWSHRVSVLICSAAWLQL